MRLFLIGALATLALAGCRSTSETAAPVATVAAFDPAEAGYIKKPGKISIHGHAFWRDDEGGTVNAAGEIIRLVPATKYARERFAVLYKGQRSLSIGQIPHVDVDPQYADYTRTARAESTGRFEFENVAPGAYFVTAQVRYKETEPAGRRRSAVGGMLGKALGVGQAGGAMFETVNVTGKEEKPIKLVLTNDR